MRVRSTLLLVALVACSESAETAAEGTEPADAVPSQSQDTAATDPAPPGHHEHGAGVGDAPAEPAVVLGPQCDEDNPITGTTAGSIDRSLPEAILQFERHLKWGCIHREYHETRQWDYIANDARYAERFAYVKKMKWVRAPVQEGAVGSGLEFLAMHRAMLGTLRDRFPAQAELFKGWTKVPTEATAADPLPPPPNGAAPATFWATMSTAIAILENSFASFSTEDELGLYIETQHRPTAENPLARAVDKTTGLHTYVHVRFDDPMSPIRMQRFSANLESETFFRLHGWVDRLWTQWRTSKGRNDTTDKVYGEAMLHACVHMGLKNWSVTKAACTN